MQNCLRKKKNILCCLVVLKSAQLRNLCGCQSDNVHCIPFDEKVFMNIVSRLHSEVDTFQICQVY